MRMTLDLPKELLNQAMNITKAKTKTELIKMALENIINQERRNKLLKYHGNINIDVALDALRNR